MDTEPENERLRELAEDNARLYEEARKAMRARERVLAIVSHDLRNSLATVLLNSSAILETVQVDDQNSAQRDQLEWIARSAEQMDRLIRDLLDLSSIEAGRLSVEPRPCDTALIVRDAVNLQSALAAESGIRLEREISASVGAVMADHERILQVLANLLGNAIKFTTPGGVVKVRADACSGSIRFQVSDSGIGIAAENLSSIFELYWQADRSRRRGAGLGLPIARAIVESHDGRIWVDSEPGVGSTFSFTLPMARV
ncbi:MAG TPA: HAMP domain-containing sensor histidine kinase [Longimicrobiaceae bacterium]|nr:HAMP domain-containing sensor histidine kinase [Longimicrobiaceae bacterium]